MEYDIEKIEDWYYNDNLTITEIASLCGCTYSTMRRAMKKMGINIRERGNICGKEYKKHVPYNKITLNPEQINVIKKLFEDNAPVLDISKVTGISSKVISRYSKELKWKRTKAMMSRDQYDDSLDERIIGMYKDGKSTTEIGKYFGITHRTVINHLKHNNIELRELWVSQFIHKNKEIPNELTDYESMYDMYVINKLSKKEIGLRLNVSPHVIDRILKKFNIHVRGVSESKIGVFAREKHPKWKGGVSGIYPILRQYFGKMQTTKTLERDKHTCQMCGAHKKLEVHHIKPFKEIFNEILAEYPQLNLDDNLEELLEIMKNDGRFLNEDNLITYCRDCHLFKVHGYKRK